LEGLAGVDGETAAATIAGADGRYRMEGMARALRPVGRLCFLALSVLAGCALSRQGTADPITEALLRKVQVQRIDLDLPVSMDQANKLLWDRFANQPYEKQFDELRSKDWRANWPRFRDRLVALARAGRFDAAALTRAIDYFSPSPTTGTAGLPVGAFAAHQGADEVWIVVFKWESIGPYESDGKLVWPRLGHIDVTAFRTKDFRVVAGVACD
jgi:hypothetical protein